MDSSPHADFKWMHCYLKVLNWSLDTSKADAMLARLQKPARKAGYYAAWLAPTAAGDRPPSSADRRRDGGPRQA
jgi:hypothetical protein